MSVFEVQQILNVLFENAILKITCKHLVLLVKKCYFVALSFYLGQIVFFSFINVVLFNPQFIIKLNNFFLYSSI